MCELVCLKYLSMQVWGSEEDVGEVLPSKCFCFLFPPGVELVGFGATEGKINTEQTSPGTQAIPRGILGMWLRMSGLPLLPHPEKLSADWAPRKDRESARDVCVLTRRDQKFEDLRDRRNNKVSPQVILTLYSDLELPALSEPTLNNASLPSRQCDL